MNIKIKAAVNIQAGEYGECSNNCPYLKSRWIFKSMCLLFNETVKYNDVQGTYIRCYDCNHAEIIHSMIKN